MAIGVFGEGVIDRFLETDGFIDIIGGSALNCAVALQRAGVNAEWIARVSTDTEGDALATYALENHVASVRTIRSNEPSSIVTVELGPQGIPTYGFELEGSVDWQWTPAELDTVFADLELLQLSSLSCVLSPGAKYLPAALEKVKNTNPKLIITYDPNARPRAAADENAAEQMRQRIESLVPFADLVKVSDEDLEWISPDREPHVVAAEWSLRGPQLVVLTRGEKGSQAFKDGIEYAATIIHALPMVDTVGAGDTFMAWLIRSIVEDHELTIPTVVEDISKMLREASKAAAINCSRKGCQPPSRDEVLS